MRIQPNDIIVGQPALAIRKLLRNRDGTFTTIVESLHIDSVTAKQIFHDLSSQGYIIATSSSDIQEDKLEWYNTIKGNALANATARKAITRDKAEQLLAAFLHRVEEINAYDDYAFYVKRIIVFGSYLSTSPNLGDVDLSILLESRYSDPLTLAKVWQERIMYALRNGKNFRNVREEQLWPQSEIFQILKGKSPSISIHDEDKEQALIKHTPSRILFEANIEKN